MMEYPQSLSPLCFVLQWTIYRYGKGQREERLRTGRRSKVQKFENINVS